MTLNENPDSSTTPPEREDPARMKQRLMWHMGVAGLMIIALLGCLALFDYLATEPDEPEPAVARFTEPVPVPQKSVTQALGPVVPAPPDGTDEQGTEAQGAGVPEASAVPEGPIVAEGPAIVDITPPPPPKVAANPGTAPAARPSSRPASMPRSAISAHPDGRSETKKRPVETIPFHPGASETNATPVSEAPPPLAPVIPQSPPVLDRLLSGYTLQAGVFVDPRRAEDVYDKLTREGIPATLETRVLVGPFKNRKEAESARAKMKAMGIDALVVRGQKTENIRGQR
jgi:DedD protein